jgi:predicted metalloprotease
MRWQGMRRSTNIEDRRGGALGGGGLRGGLGGGRGIGIGGGLGAIVVVVIALLFGVDPSALLNGGGSGVPSDSPGVSGTPSDEQGQFVSAVLASTEDTWSAIFAADGKTYQDPKLVLFNGSVNSACGSADAAVGPFYCPGDQQLYLDLDFFDQLSSRFGAPGDFAAAYVIAHEVGHHVQTLLGTMAKVDGMRGRLDEAEANALSVRVELQADCYAGVWAKRGAAAQGVLEAGDTDEALGAAAAVGDDTLQSRSQGYVVPDSFTHGTSAQRRSWFGRGFDSGDPDNCDTFSARTL